MSESLSLTRFASSIASARMLREVVRDPRFQPLSQEKKTRFLHAALAAYVAAWDSYLNQVIKEFIDKLMVLDDLDFLSLHAIFMPIATQKLQKFNTPNWENSRELLVGCTGYDPISDWTWRKAQFNRQQTHDFLNQILKVRHSFAHGFSMPAYTWTQTPSGRIQLNNKSLYRVERFFVHLGYATDRGLNDYGSVRFPGRTFW